MKKPINIFLSAFFAIVFLSQFALQIAHVLENHEHEVCLSKTEKHIHEKNPDCKELHYLIKINSSNIQENFDIDSYNQITSIDDAVKSSDYSYNLTKKSSRAPPIQQLT